MLVTLGFDFLVVASRCLPLVVFHYPLEPAHAFHLVGPGLGGELLRYVLCFPIRSLGTLIRSRQGLLP